MKVTVKIESTYKSIEITSECNDVKIVTLSRKQIEVERMQQPINMTVVQNQTGGWSEFRNNSIYYNSPEDNAGIPLPQGEFVILPLRDDGGIKEEQTPELIGFVDPDTHHLISTKLNSYFTPRIDLKIKSSIPGVVGFVEFYRPDVDVNFNQFEVNTGNDPSKPKTNVYQLQFYTGWIDPAPAYIRIKMTTGSATLYGVNAQFKQDHRGKG